MFLGLHTLTQPSTGVDKNNFHPTSALSATTWYSIPYGHVPIQAWLFCGLLSLVRRLLIRPLTIHRLHSVFAVLNCCCLASLLRSVSSHGVVVRGFPVIWRYFTLPVWFTHCFNRTMTEWLTLNRSAACLVGHTTITIPTACHLSASDSIRCAMLN